MVGVVIKSARDLWPVVALMLLMFFVFTVLGMQLFGASLNPNLASYKDFPYALKTRFDTFFWSFVQVGMLFGGEEGGEGGGGGVAVCNQNSRCFLKTINEI